MKNEWMTYEQLLEDGWKEGEEVLMGFIGSDGGVYHHVITCAEQQLKNWDVVKFMRFQPYKKKYYVEKEVGTVLEVWIVRRADDGYDDGYKVAVGIGTREAAEQIAAIFEGKGV